MMGDRDERRLVAADIRRAVGPVWQARLALQHRRDRENIRERLTRLFCVVCNDEVVPVHGDVGPVRDPLVVLPEPDPEAVAWIFGLRHREREVAMAENVIGATALAAPDLIPSGGANEEPSRLR